MHLRYKSVLFKAPNVILRVRFLNKYTLNNIIIQARFREHINNQGPMKHHSTKCRTPVTTENVEILASTSRGEGHLMTLEALYIQELELAINTRDEYRSRTLTIQIKL